MAKACKGTAGGTDGWSSAELACLSCIWHDVVALFDFMLEQGETPRCFQEIRQTQLPKASSRVRDDGAVSAAFWRPISICSILWRLLTSAVAQSNDTKQ